MNKSLDEMAKEHIKHHCHDPDRCHTCMKELKDYKAGFLKCQELALQVCERYKSEDIMKGSGSVLNQIQRIGKAK